MNNIVLIGPPGSGKGTQAALLQQHYNIEHISSGDVLRKEVAAGTDFGKEIKQHMDKGEIGPVELITNVILEYIKPLAEKGFILDGFPRTMYQARMLQDAVPVTAAFYIAVSEDEIIKRITGRRSCKKCGAIYHITFNPPKEVDICDCGDNLIVRSDDTVETAKTRIKVFQNETVPVLDYFRKTNIFHTIDGEQNKQNIFEAIKKHLVL